MLWENSSCQGLKQYNTVSLSENAVRGLALRVLYSWYLLVALRLLKSHQKQTDFNGE
jgi:hypothetical protein